MEMLGVSTAAGGRACIAAFQINCARARTKAKQIENAERHLEMARPFLGKASLALFPELSTVGDINLEANIDLAETLEGPVCDRMIKAAKAGGTWIGFGLPRADADGRAHNSYVMAVPTGDLLYSNHNYGLEAQVPGYLNFSHNGVSAGLAVCNDVRGDRNQREIMRTNPELLLIPMMTGHGATYHYFARVWRTSILSINYAGEEFGFSSFHHYDGSGRVARQSLSPREGVLVVSM